MTREYLTDQDGERSASPTSLSEIIGCPSHASLYLTTQSQIDDLTGDIEPLNVKGLFSEWWLITLHPHSEDHISYQIYAVGTRGMYRSTMTSPVTRIDFKTGYIQTRNSVYSIDLNARGKGEPHRGHIENICGTLWSWNLGIPLGIPLVIPFELASVR
ncbi:MAG: hypothetical protein IPO38_00425 [Rhodocyclaceae bacterium]|nr:hypothetical protein [Rhodocyclaceae bacterium]MBP6108673.1 hypothetical protein [Rhodocyclaceae bacterium]